MLKLNISLDAPVATIVYVNEKLSDLRDFYEDYIYPKVLRDLDKMFEVEGRPPWAALNEVYAHYKNIHFPGAGILERTGELRDSYTISSHPSHVLQIGPKSFSLKSGVHYASLHETGVSSTNLPARPVVGGLTLDKGLRNQYNKVFRRHVQRVIKQGKKQAAHVGVQTSYSKSRSGTLTIRRG